MTKPADPQAFAFCEHAVANSHGIWHIRPLTDTGKHCGGGVDTNSLCDFVKARREVATGPKRPAHAGVTFGGWDIDVDVVEYLRRAHLGGVSLDPKTRGYGGVCTSCLTKYMTSTSELRTDGKTTWVNREVLLGRFSEKGIDVHVAGQCTDESCIPGPCGPRQWVRFKELMLEHHRVEVTDKVMPDYLRDLPCPYCHRGIDYKRCGCTQVLREKGVIR